MNMAQVQWNRLQTASNFTWLFAVSLLVAWCVIILMLENSGKCWEYLVVILRESQNLVELLSSWTGSCFWLPSGSMGFLRKFPQSAQWGWASGKPASNGKHFRWHIAVILSAKLPLDEEEMCWTLSWATVFGLWLRTLNSKWIAPG